MKFDTAEIYTADAGYRTAKYLRVTTDSGFEGWSEFYDHHNGSSIEPALLSHIERMRSIGIDPRDSELVGATLRAATRIVAGGLNQQAIAAIENACVDIQAKALRVPAYAVLGGKFRTEIPVYWTHYGSFRAAFPDFYREAYGFEPMTGASDLARLADELQQTGVRAVKTNPMRFAEGRAAMYGNGTRIDRALFEPRKVSALIDNLHAALGAIRSSLGDEIDMMLDVNLLLGTTDARRVAKALAPHDLAWLEIDGLTPGALSDLRRDSPMPIASLETLYSAADALPYFELRAVDVPIVDVLWVGGREAVRLAHVADAFGLEIAIHNPVGPFGTLISAHYAASIKNLRVLELRVDEAPWVFEHLADPPTVHDGSIRLSEAPGWGIEPRLDRLTLASATSKNSASTLPHAAPKPTGDSK